MKKKFKIRLTILILMALVIIATMGCGSSKKEDVMVSNESKSNMAISAGDSAFGTSNNSVTKDEAKLENSDLNKASDVRGNSDSKDTLAGQGKIIKNAIIKMETLNFDETVEHILNKTNAIGGYVQSSNTSGRRIEAKLYDESRSGEFVLRIPKSKFDGFMLDMGTSGNIINQELATENVTAAYFDTQAHLKSLNIQEERLLELLKKTGELKDIILLEKELSSVRYEIESLTGNLKKWDNLIDFCTLSINLREVYKIKENPISFGGKIVNGFTDSIRSLIDFGKGFIVIISICIPYIVILSFALLIARYIFTHWKRK